MQTREMAQENSNDDTSEGAGMDPYGMGDGEINVDAIVGKTTGRGSVAAIGINDTGESWVPQRWCSQARWMRRPSRL
jgi:hypothetical protein